MAQSDSATLKTTQRSLEVVSALQDLGSARVTELATELDMAPSTVHSHLATLEELEYVVKEGDLYHLGLEFLSLGESVRDRSDAYRYAQEKVEKLAEETGWRAHFVVEEHGRGVYVYSSAGEHTINAYASVGKRMPLHVSAAGKSILASLDRSRVEAILDRRGLEPKTENTITDRETLYEELARIRERGYAFNREEHLTGINAVGAPVEHPGGQVIGAFSVSAPVHRMKGDRLEEELPNVLLGISNELELNVTYS